MRKRKITEGYEVKKEYAKRKYGKKEKWRLAEMVLIMESGDNFKIAIRKTERTKHSVIFFIDSVYNALGIKYFGLNIGFTNSTKMFKEAIEIANIHPSFYKSVSKRIGKRIKKLKITEKIINVVG